MRHADLVVDLPLLLDGVGRQVQLLPVLEADRVDYDMRVDVVGIGVGGDDTLVIWEQLFGQLTGNLICLPWRDLLLIREGMNKMKEANVRSFFEHLLRRRHLKVAGVGSAVDTAFHSVAIKAHFFILKHISQRAKHPSCFFTFTRVKVAITAPPEFF